MLTAVEVSLDDINLQENWKLRGWFLLLGNGEGRNRTSNVWHKSPYYKEELSDVRAFSHQKDTMYDGSQSQDISFIIEDNIRGCSTGLDFY